MKKNPVLGAAKARPLLSKPGFAVGLEQDHLAVRGARLAADGKGGFAVDRLEEVRGNFVDDAALIEALRSLKGKLGMGARDAVVTCLGGKQVFASQIGFRRLPKEEMEQALRLELRKSMHFEVMSGALDYQILTEGESKGDTVQVLVSVVAGSLLSGHLKVLEKADIKPTAVDVLPVAAANAMWTWLGSPKHEQPHAAVHVGPSVSTIVIDGVRSPFFNRNVYFSAEEVFAKEPSLALADKRLPALADEVARSLAFYEKTFFASGFTEILLLGEYLESAVIEDLLRRRTGLPTRRMDIPKRMGGSSVSEAGRFDLAVALALRGDD